MQVQPQLILLQKTLLNIEALGRQLYPELNLWTTAKPFLEQWMSSRVGPKAIWKSFRRHTPYWVHRLPEVPEKLFKALEHVQMIATSGEQQTQQLAVLGAQMAKLKRIAKVAVVIALLLNMVWIGAFYRWM